MEQIHSFFVRRDCDLTERVESLVTMQQRCRPLYGEQFRDHKNPYRLLIYTIWANLRILWAGFAVGWTPVYNVINIQSAIRCWNTSHLQPHKLSFLERCTECTWLENVTFSRLRNATKPSWTTSCISGNRRYVLCNAVLTLPRITVTGFTIHLTNTPMLVACKKLKVSLTGLAVTQGQQYLLRTPFKHRRQTASEKAFMKQVDQPTRVRLTAPLPSDISLLQYTLWKLLR
jgi:hypothetical protein